MSIRSVRTAAAVLALTAAAAMQCSASGIRWAKTYKAAQREASRSGKLIMVDFYTDWCHWCKVLDDKVYTDPGVILASKRFVNVKLNAEKEGRASARSLRVKGFPTVFFLKADGTAVSSIEGFLPASEFRAAMERLAATTRRAPR